MLSTREPIKVVNPGKGYSIYYSTHSQPTRAIWFFNKNQDRAASDDDIEIKEF